MRPINFDDCFGWLHDPAPEARERHFGVVICGSVGFEKQVLHRPLRVLAQRLAEHGVPALRFDYPGTGDSGGLDTDPGQVAAWLQSIDDAAAQLQRLTGVTEVVLCGAHLGATLAAVAGAHRHDRRMVLLAPVASGRRFVRTLRLVASMAADAESRPPNDSFAIEAAGLRLTAATVASLEALDIGRLPGPPARQVLLLDAPGRADALAVRLRESGVEVSPRDFVGLDRLMVDADSCEVPAAAWTQVTQWLLAGDTPAVAHRRHAPVAAWTPWRPTPQAIERPVQFGGIAERMVGIYCAPAGLRASIGVVLCNTGSNPHYGPGRLSVHLARLLAAHGIASLRVDLPGLGDAERGDETRPPHLYLANRGQELRLALDQMEAFGQTRLAMFGVCSGAFHAMRLALTDPRVRDLMLINQPLFEWGAEGLGGRLRRVLRARLHALGASRHAGADATSSIEMLQAQTSRTSEAWQRLRRAGFRLAALGRRLGLRAASDPRRRFGSLAARGVRTLVAVGRQDAALTLLEGHFGAEGRALRALPGAMLLIDPAFDHSMASQAACDRIGPALVDFLTAAPPPS